MTWLRARALPLVGILCLGGQGILLYVAGTGAETATVPWPGLFILLTLGLTLSLALSGRRSAPVMGCGTGRGRIFWRVITLLAAVALLGVGLVSLQLRAPPQAVDHSTDLEATVDRMLGLAPALSEWWELAGPALQVEGDLAGVETKSHGGDAFRLLAPLPLMWQQGGGELPLGVVLWQEDERLAWAGSVEPLSVFPQHNEVPGEPEWDRVLTRGHSGWVLQQVTRLATGAMVEVQVRLTDAGALAGAPGVEFLVGAINDPALTMDDSGLLIRQIGFGPGDREPFVHLLARAEPAAVRRNVVKARLLMVAFLAWAVALLGLARLALGPGAGVLALWVGRGLLASGEALRWVGGAFPQRTFPAPPDSWFSLVDPAYFATPLGQGWFASTADAFLTALVVAATIWYVLQRRGLVMGSATRKADLVVRPLLGHGLVGGLLFGAASGVVLLALAFLARMLAANANPRLIGTGVSLSFLSFWGLQIVLMLLAFSLVALATGLIAGARWPGHGDRSTWSVGGVAAGIVAAVVVTIGGTEGWWAGRLLAAFVVAGLWFSAPALRAKPHFLRRFGWPVMMLLAVCWNYASLRLVYDEAERSWLETKRDQITQADPGWSRFLLGSVLNDMIEDDGRRLMINEGQGLWKDEAAWQLYRASAFSDLGHLCSVELMDPADNEESFFALGFMNALNYEVISRTSWVDMSGQPVSRDMPRIFRTERRRYPGGEEEVLTAEAKRDGGRGWLRVEMPVRSWRVTTLLDGLVGESNYALGRYRPRAEVDRPLLLMLADDQGWLDTGVVGIPGQESDRALASLRSGEQAWTEIQVDGERWVCLWKALPASFARTAGEGFLLGVRRAHWREDVLDLSRLMLLDLGLFFLLLVAVQLRRWLLGLRQGDRQRWRPGFQERFLVGYLMLGLVLLVLVGMTVDQVGYERVQAEARSQTRTGLVRTVEQLRTLLTEQASSLVNSDYIDELMAGRATGVRPAGTENFQQGMVFAADGELLLDETLSDLSREEAHNLLNAGRTSPLVIVRDAGELFVAVTIPIHLGDWVALPDTGAAEVGHRRVTTNGFFFYRQRLDKGLIGSLAELVVGQITLDVDGQPLLASHPAAVFSGAVPLLADPDKMTPVWDHLQGASVFAAAGRPFAFTAGRPMTALSRDGAGQLVVDTHPAVLNLEFPDREREYEDQRNGTVLLLAGLANLILLTALFLALLMSWNIFRPLHLLLTATKSLAQGDYDAPLPEAGQDEVGRLAGAFDSMRGQLQSARDDLAAREQFLSTVLGRVTVGVAVVDAEDKIVVLNPAGAHILTDFRPELPENAGVIELMAKFRALGQDRMRAAGEVVSSDGRHTVRGALAPLALPGDRTDTMLVFEDITEFLSTKKMAINAELARQVAHEIKNPLTPIQLSVQHLQQAWQDQHPQLDRIVPDTVERVLQQVTLLRSIATEFSLLGRPGELETEAVDLQALVQSVTSAYAPDGEMAGDNQVVDMESQELPLVVAHGESLQKILGNLMQNSLDAARPDCPLRVQVSWRLSAASLTLIWRDNGLGLSSEVADRLFDPYFSTKSKGTGLGLVICRNLADRMHGSITLANNTGGPGAVAELTLPRVAAE